MGGDRRGVQEELCLVLSAWQCWEKMRGVIPEQRDEAQEQEEGSSGLSAQTPGVFLSDVFQNT